MDRQERTPSEVAPVSWGHSSVKDKYVVPTAIKVFNTAWLAHYLFWDESRTRLLFLETTDLKYLSVLAWFNFFLYYNQRKANV